MKNNTVGWFEIYVEDMERAKKFYEAVFMQKLEKLEAEGCEFWMFPWIDGAMGAGGALVKMPHAKPGIGGTLVYFSCEDCAVEQARVAANGGKVEVEKFAIGEHGFTAIVMDTEGNMIGLHSMK